MRPRAKSRWIAALAVAGLVGGGWACGSIAPDGPNSKDRGEGDAMTFPPGTIPEAGFPFEGFEFDGGRGFPFGDGEVGFDARFFDREAFQDGNDFFEDGNDLADRNVFDGGFEDDGGFFEDDSGFFFDSGPPDAGPPWDGGAPVTIASGEQEPVALALDGTNVYWENSGGTVLACPLAGCPNNVPTLLAFNGQSFFDSSESMAAGSSTAFFLGVSAIDSCPSGGCGLAPKTYWSPVPSDAGLDASQEDFDAGIASPRGVVSDSTSLYFTDGTTVYSCPIASTCSSPKTLFSTPFDSVGSLAVGAGQVYFVENGEAAEGGILAVPIGGGATARVVCKSSLLFDVNSIVASGSYVYFTSGDDSSSIYECPAGGGTATIFASDEFPFALAADSANLYWTNADGAGVIGTCPLGATCTGSRTVASNQDRPNAIAVNATTVYWTTQTAIRSAAK